MQSLRSRLTREVWFLAYRFDPEFPADLLELGEGGGGLDGFSFLRPPPSHFWADPFPIRVGGRQHIVFEDFDYRRRRGCVAAIAVLPEGPVGEPRAVMSLDHHLSYPFIFNHGGETFLVPESSATETVELFRCIEFPDRWVSEAKLLDGISAVDPTLFHRADRWWLFVATASDPDRPLQRDRLDLYCADQLAGPWGPHPGNPVVEGSIGVRPAGRVFEIGGRLYRPAQDASARYGGAIIIHEIISLTTEDYREEPRSGIQPTWAPDIIGTHTLNHADGLTVLDGLERQWRLPGF